MLLSWPLYPCSQDLICPVHIISSLLIFCVLLIKFHKSSDENHELNNGSRQKPILPAPGVKKLINSNYIIFWPRKLWEEKILYKFHSVVRVGKVWCGSDCTGRGIMMKRMMIHIRSVRVRGLPEPWRMFLADWIHSESVRRGRGV